MVVFFILIRNFIVYSCQMNTLLFQNPFEFFIFFYDLKFFLQVSKNEPNVKNFAYFYVTRFHITLKKISKS